MKFYEQCMLIEAQYIKTKVYPHYTRPESYIGPKTDTRIKLQGLEKHKDRQGVYFKGRGFANYSFENIKHHENFHLIMDRILYECEECYNYILSELILMIRVGSDFIYRRIGEYLTARKYNINDFYAREEIVAVVQDIVNSKEYRDDFFKFINVKNEITKRHIMNRLKRIQKMLIYYFKNLKKIDDTVYPGITPDDVLKKYGFL